LFTALLLLAPAPLRADEGRIPIYQATTITSPGHYVVTRDISLGSGASIVIQSDDVTLDLGGRSITGPGFASPSALITITSGSTDITVRNGRLISGGRGLRYQSTTDPIRLRLEDLEFIDTDEEVIIIDKTEHIEMLNCRITNPGNAVNDAVSISNQGGPFHGRIVGNVISRTVQRAFVLDGITGSEISRNTVQDTSLGSSGYTGMYVQGSGNLIELNTVETFNGSGLSVIGNHNIIRGNVITNNEEIGLGVLGDGNRITDNVVDNNGDGNDGPYGMVLSGSFNILAGNHVIGNDGDGLVIYGSENLLEANSFSNNVSGTPASACGIHVMSGSHNVYRNSVLRGNENGAVCGSATDGGGNIL